MIGLIVTGHGNFGTGLTSSLNLIAGEQQNYYAVDFTSDYSVEDLERDLNKALDALSDCEGILMLSDLVGGSPFKSSVILSTQRQNVEVIGGTNLAMLVEVAMARNFNDDLQALTEMAVNTGKDAVVHYVFQPVEEQTCEDGI